MRAVSTSLKNHQAVCWEAGGTVSLFLSEETITDVLETCTLEPVRCGQILHCITGPRLLSLLSPLLKSLTARPEGQVVTFDS